MASTFDQVRAADARRRLSAATETEQAIFAGTERLLSELQLHDVSVQKITEASGVSRATFYRYFTSKDAVIAGLLARVMDEVFEAIAGFVNLDANAEDGDPASILRESLAAGWSVWENHLPVMRAVSENWHRVPELEELWLSIIDRFTAAMAGQIDRDRQAGLAPPGPDSRELAAMLLWSTERCMYVAARDDGRSPGTVQAALGPVTTMWVRCIYGDTNRRS